MGYVELRDGISNRRIRVPELGGTVQIDVADTNSPAVTIPDDVTVLRDADIEIPLDELPPPQA